jgi:hypothetical protein
LFIITGARRPGANVRAFKTTEARRRIGLTLRAAEGQLMRAGGGGVGAEAALAPSFGAGRHEVGPVERRGRLRCFSAVSPPKPSARA